MNFTVKWGMTNYDKWKSTEPCVQGNDGEEDGMEVALWLCFCNAINVLHEPYMHNNNPFVFYPHCTTSWKGGGGGNRYFLVVVPNTTFFSAIPASSTFLGFFHAAQVHFQANCIAQHKKLLFNSLPLHPVHHRTFLIIIILISDELQ